MPTIKDIARLAGVSHGTVSNVLNKKGNVSIEKIILVENAAKALGYKRNAMASQLRQGRNKFIAAILPDLRRKTYVDLLTSLEHTLQDENYVVNGYLTSNNPHSERRVLDQVLSLNPDHVIVISSLLENDGLYDNQHKYIFINRSIGDMPGNAVYISFDFHAAGLEMGKRIAADGHKRVALFCGMKTYSDESLFQQGLTETLEKERCSLVQFSSEDSLVFRTAIDLQRIEQPFDAIVTSNMERIEYLHSALSLYPEHTLPELYTLSSTEILPMRSLTKYELNYKQLGRKIGEYILKTGEDGSPSVPQLQIPNDGFRFELSAIQPIRRTRKLNFMTLASPASEALQRILPLCALDTGIKVELTALEYNELHSTARAMTRGSFYDLIRLDMLWLSELGPALFSPLEPDAPGINALLSSINQQLSSEYFKIDETYYSLPFDPSVQMLFYRKDLFEDMKVRREFYEQHKRQLGAPRNYEDYNLIARFFTKRYNPGSPTDYGASLVFGTAVVAACDYLPRFKALGGEIMDERGRVQIDTPLAREALQSYMETFDYTVRTTNMWWGKALESFSAGNTAMVSSFTNHASDMVLSKGSNVIDKIGFANLPGGHPLLGGGVVGISKDSEKYDECIEFLRWLFQPSISAIITYLGGFSPSSTIHENEDLLTLYPWIKDIEKAFNLGSRRNMNNSNPHFSEGKFEEILGTEVRNAVIGITDIDSSLKHAQDLIDQEFLQGRL